MIEKIVAVFALLYGAPVMSFYMSEMATTAGPTCPRDSISPVATIGCAQSLRGDTKSAAAAPLPEGITSCEAPANSPGLWYKFANPVGGELTFSFTVTSRCELAAPYDTVLHIFDNECTPACLAGADQKTNACPSDFDSNRLSVTSATYGPEYLVFISGNNDSGEFELSTSCV